MGLGMCMVSGIWVGVRGRNMIGYIGGEWVVSEDGKCRYIARIEVLDDLGHIQKVLNILSYPLPHEVGL